MNIHFHLHYIILNSKYKRVCTMSRTTCVILLWDGAETNLIFIYAQAHLFIPFLDVGFLIIKHALV